jgi:GTP cyclohydrolase II
MVAAAESVDLDSLRAVYGEAAGFRLVLPAPRLNVLGIPANEARSVRLDDMSSRDLRELVFGEPHTACSDLTPATHMESTALRLVKLSFQVPAAIVAETRRTADTEDLLEVSSPAVVDYHSNIAHTLRIAARTRIPLCETRDAEFVVFQGGDGLRDQLAVIIGRPSAAQSVPVRLHSACLTGDLFGSLKCDCGDQLRRAVADINAAGGGVLLYLDQEGRGIGLRNKIRAYRLQDLGHDTVDADAVLGYGPDERRYEIAGRMLDLLGYRKVSVMTNNPEKLAALQNFGLEITGRRPLHGTVNRHNLGYLSTKQNRAGHILDLKPQD